MIKAVIFDMDGVIIDSEPLWYKACLKYLETKGKTFSNNRAGKNFVNAKIRGRTQDVITKIFKKQFDIKDSIQKISNDRLKIVLDALDKELKIMPGAIASLKRLKAQNYKLLMASSSPRKIVNYAVKKYKLKKYLQKTVAGDDFQHSKPHPQIFLESAKFLKEKPANILVIEDSYSGIRAAKRAGMKCIALKQPYNTYKYLKKADLTVKSLKDINLKTILATSN